MGVCSQLTYRSEVWKLDGKSVRRLDDIDIRLLHHITGKTYTYKEETSEDTRTFDLVGWICQIRARCVQ